MTTGTPLFNRTKAGYVLTARGEALLSVAQAMEEQFSLADENLIENIEKVSGTVRVGCVEGYAVEIISPHIPRLLSEYPDLVVDLVIQPRPIQLSRNEADIVITLDRPSRGPYIITKLCDYTLKLYASPSYIKDSLPRSLPDLARHRMVGYIEEAAPAKDLPALIDLAPGKAISLRSTSVFSQLAAVREGAGIALLPSYLAAGQGLQPVMSETVSFQRTYWLLMPLELKRISRMRVVWNFLRAIAKQESHRLSG